MVIVVGGACQGKLEFVRQQYDVTDGDIIDGETCSIEKIPQGKVIYHFHLLLRRMLWEMTQQKVKENAEEVLYSYMDTLMEQCPQSIIICDEIGCGLVPVDAFERTYRDVVGRCMCRLTAQAQEVIRVNCGIAERIKG